MTRKYEVIFWSFVGVLLVVSLTGISKSFEIATIFATFFSGTIYTFIKLGTELEGRDMSWQLPLVPISYLMAVVIWTVGMSYVF